MAKKLPKLDKNKRVKAIARTRVGMVRPARVLSVKPLRARRKYKTAEEDSTE